MFHIFRRLKEYKKQQREWEREKANQQRELERLEKELSLRNTATIAQNLTNQKAATSKVEIYLAQ